MPLFQRDNTIEIYYEIFGAGPALLMLHGFMGTGQTEFPALAAHYAKRYQVILPDLRGYGRSGPKPRRYPPDFYHQDAEDLAALLAHLNMEQVIVMGYSDGGEVALALALRAPQRVAGVVTWGATGNFSPQIKPAILSMLNMNWRSSLIDELHGAEHIQAMTYSWVQGMTQIIDQGGDITLSRAGEIRASVLMLLGDSDPLNPVPNGQKMAAALPHCKLRIFRKTGHAIHSERPFWFRWHINSFLRQIRYPK